MRDKRPVDELSIEELERILAIRKREERAQRLKRMARSGRVVETSQDAAVPEFARPTPPVAAPVPVAKALPKTPSAAPKPRPAAPSFEDEVDAIEYEPKGKRTGEDEWRRFVNRALMLVEVAAVAGLVYLGVNMLTAIGKLENETAAAQAQSEELRRAGIPTLEPTPQLQVSAFVLPGGHTLDANGAQFNYAEVPEHLRSLAQTQLVLPPISRPPATDETALAISVPALNINDQPIVQGVDWEALRQGVGQLPNGVTPADDAGNVVLAAHNDIYGELFRHLDDLQPGDQFQIRTQNRVYTYTVSHQEIVQPNDVSVMDSGDTATATLISCYPYQVDTKRIVIFADREDG